jgi:hypothetical protein
MLRRLTSGFVIFVATVIHAAAQDPRDAVINSLQLLGMTQSVQRDQISLAPHHFESSPLIRGAHYDSTLRAWLVELRCAPPRRCVPSLATVHIDNPRLISTAPALGNPSTALIRSGDRRLLISIFGKIRMTEQVVCLQSGRAGQTIRVRAIATRVVKQALVLDSGQLRLVPSL